MIGYVPGCVPWCCCCTPVLLLLIPVAPVHAVSVRASKDRVRRESIQSDFRRALFPLRRTHPGKSNNGAKRTAPAPKRREVEELGVVVIVMVTVAAPVPGVTGFGVNVHRESAGRPEQERVTAFGKDEPSGLTVNA